MMTAKKMIDKIIWDPTMNRDEYTIHYWDNVAKKLKPINITEMTFKDGDKFSFQIQIDGDSVDIPYHRIKRIDYEGKIIWERKIK